MTGIVWQANIVDLQGNVLNAASVEVRHQISGALALLFSDFNLTLPISNPTLSDVLGAVKFFVPTPDLYRIIASKGGFVREWSHVVLNESLPGQIILPEVVDEVLPAGDTNDWAPAVTALTGRIRITGDPAGSELTGMNSGDDGRRIVLTNAGANTITIRDESALSIAINRFAINGDMLLGQFSSAEFLYDDVISRWTRIGA